MITIRALRRNEEPLLDDLLTRMSPRSRYLRFHSAVPELRGAMRRALLDIDDRHHIALIALVDEVVVGIVRLIRDRDMPGEAEVSVAVADAWHRSGVGRQLLEKLVERARVVGVTRLHASVLPWNRAAIGLFRSVFPGALFRRVDDVLDIVCLLGDQDDWEITMDDVLNNLIG